MDTKTTIKKRELLFLYESKYSIPNGDPFTGEQRYDDETKKILVSDVRIKRFIRDYLENKGMDIFVSDKSLGDNKEVGKKEEKESGASRRYKALCKKFGIAEDKPQEILSKVVDIRLFGGIITVKKDNINFTGPVQFSLLNQSLNRVNLRIHQNTSVFVSSTENKQGAIGTTSVVPYAINQIHGWVNPFSALETGLTEEDVKVMFEGMWKSINLANTRSKSGQTSLLLLSVNYATDTDKLYDLESSIELDTKDKEDESIRSFNEIELKFDKFLEAVKSDKVAEVEFYTDNQKIKSVLSQNSKLKFMDYLA